MNSTSLEHLMRWYGPSDPVTLDHIAQAGCTGVVSALYNIAPGEIWKQRNIHSYKKFIVSKKLNWTVVESLPVHEQIKTGGENRNQYLENYIQSLINLSREGIEVVTYNFMPVLDWLRTDVSFKLPNQAEALAFNKIDYGVFDLLLLKRPNASQDYSFEEIERINKRFDSMNRTKRKQLFDNILLALPGNDSSFTADQVLELLKKYHGIDRGQLKHNLIYFLKEITPIAENIGIKLAIHPDDPPFSVLGLPRIMSTDKDIEDIMKAVPSMTNGLCFCTGSFGARADNQLIEMIKKWGERIYFLHLRNTKRDHEGNFWESNHLDGDADMFTIMCEVIKIMQRENRKIPVRPDHGHKMLGDLGKKFYPGYSAIGRLKGLAEIRGLEYGVKNFLNQLGKN